MNCNNYRPSYHSSCPAWQWVWAHNDGVFLKELLYQSSHRGLPARFPGLMCFAISFAGSSTCWHLKGSLLCPVTTLSPMPSHFSIVTSHLQLPLGRGVSYRSPLASIQPSPVLASDPSWISNVLWTEVWPLLSWATVTGKQHVGNVLCTVPVRKGNSSFNSKTLSCLEPVLRHAFYFLVLQSPRTLILGTHGNTQSPSEAECFSPPPQRGDKKLTFVNNPLLIPIRSSKIRRMIPPARMWTTLWAFLYCW